MDAATLALVVAGIGIVGTLLGTAAGAVLGMWSDRQKWKRERLAKRREHEREALQFALKWLDPIDSALMRVTLLIPRIAAGQVDRDEMYQKIPNLMGTLAALDLPPHLQVMLPEGTYRKGLSILHEFGELTAMAKLASPYEDLASMAEALQSKADAQRHDLTAAYRKTFE